MINNQRRRARFDVADCAERNLRAATGTDINVIERIGIAAESRRDFQHDMILVQLREHGGHQALAESIVKRVVNLLHAEAQPGSVVAIDNQRRFQPVILLIRGDVAQGGQGSQLPYQPVRPRVQLLLIRAFHGVLELRAADAVFHREILNRLHVKRDAFH